ncbi:MAG: hypothetical protein HY438_03640 [DPANN group archaeon]|nr:hypothetical protein [DPANN group archaeon]
MTKTQITEAINAVRKMNFDAAKRLISEHEKYTRTFMKNKLVNADVRGYYNKVYKSFLNETKKSIRVKHIGQAIAYLETLKDVFDILVLKVNNALRRQTISS